jgi:hypothetical protein
MVHVDPSILEHPFFSSQLTTARKQSSTSPPTAQLTSVYCFPPLLATSLSISTAYSQPIVLSI